LRTYEALYIVSPEVEDDDIQTIAKTVEELVTKDGGTIVRSEIWGRRKLAYEVKKHSEGSFILLRFTANAAFIARLETYFKLSETIIRYLVVHFDAHTLRLEEEQQRQREEELRTGGRSSRDQDDDDDDDDRPGRGDYYPNDRFRRDRRERSGRPAGVGAGRGRSDSDGDEDEDDD